MAWKEVAEVATRDFKTGTKRVADIVVVDFDECWIEVDVEMDGKLCSKFWIDKN